MKKFKMTISIVLSVLICFGGAVSAFAADTNLENNSYATGTVDGKLTANAISSYYNNYADVEKFHIQQNPDLTISKIVASDTEVTVDNFTADYEYVSSTVITAELPVFGGYYRSADYNFIVFGQNNPEDSDDVEVIRVVKYTHNWERLGALSIYGANTYIPFDAGSCRMSDDGETLFIHTSHEMYLYSDGKHHQANLQLYVKMSDMTKTYIAYAISNIGTGYCSHSFDQYIKNDGAYVYTVDHGDAHPRSVVICKKDTSGKMVKYKDLLKIVGASGDNTTGVTLGDFELTGNKCITAGISSDQSDENANTYIRNVFLAFTDKNLDEVNLVWLTDFSVSNAVQRPEIILLENNMFYVVWNEKNGSSYRGRVMKVDENGTVLEEYSIPVAFSECEPIIIGEDLVWFNSDGKKTVFYHINPAAYSPLTEEEALFYTVDENGNATITGISNLFMDDELVIPEVIDGHPVVAIGASAFKSSKNAFSSVVIPGSVKTIAEYAFNNKGGLKSITLGKGIETIGDYAFSGTDIESITIPDSVTSMGSDAFSYCDNVTELTIPGSIKTIANSAFFSMDNLETVTILDGVETIEKYAFCGSPKLTTVNLPDSVSSLGAGCFQLTALTELYIPLGVTDFSRSVINKCDTITQYAVSPEHTRYTVVDGILFSKDMKTVISYPSAKSGTVYTIPSSTVEIEESAFEGCNNLEEVYCPKSIILVCNYAFYNCANLKKVTFDGKLYYLAYYVFMNCPSLESVTAKSDKLYSGVFKNCTSLKNVAMSGSFSSIPTDCFANCTSLESIVLPSGVKSVGSKAFSGCTALKELILRPAVTTIDDTAFNGCENLSLYCCSDSTAHTYAVNKEIPYVLIDRILAVDGTDTVVDNENKLIYGVQPAQTGLTETLQPAMEGYSISADSEKVYTGMTVALADDSNSKLAEYTVVIFGDVNGDSWYDGQDAIIVDCLANGMLTKDNVSEAVYTAADCNHDGVIDQLDVDLLNEAGALLANVDQSKSAEVLLETSAEYVEYIDLIDQSPEIETEDDTDIPDVDVETEETPEADTEDAKVDIFEMILNFIKSIFEMLLSYIPMPLK